MEKSDEGSAVIFAARPPCVTLGPVECGVPDLGVMVVGARTARQGSMAALAPVGTVA